MSTNNSDDGVAYEEVETEISKPEPTKVTVDVESNSASTRFLAFFTVFLAIVVICLSVAIASLPKDRKRSKTVTERYNTTTTMYDTVMASTKPGYYLSGDNICEGTDVGLPNVACAISDYYLGTGEQSGVNVTKGYQGDYDVNDDAPIFGGLITTEYWEAGLCPVNVHWHLGTEHFSLGQFDHNGVGPSDDDDHRRLGSYRQGYQCHHYDDTDPIFTTEYDWKHCVDTHVGETYEIHWPHSNMGACGTPNQYQYPFYDGVFCRFATDFGGSLTDTKIGVQGQVFTIVNDEDYYYPDLFHGAIVEGEMWSDVAKYTGSTTGTSRNNDDSCSQYTGITWQVDRKCHLISASSFDKMCADMKSQRDDMSSDLYAHGARELVSDEYAANNQERIR